VYKEKYLHISLLLSNFEIEEVHGKICFVIKTIKCIYLSFATTAVRTCHFVQDHPSYPAAVLDMVYLIWILLCLLLLYIS